MLGNHSLFHKPNRIGDLPLKLPGLSINNQEIKRTSCTKFLSDENLSWKDYLKLLKIKLQKVLD